eukprot:Awhi_evm1s2296
MISKSTAFLVSCLYLQCFAEKRIGSLMTNEGPLAIQFNAAKDKSCTNLSPLYLRPSSCVSLSSQAYDQVVSWSFACSKE